MPIEIQNAAIHRIEKKQHTKGKGSVTSQPSDEELPKNELLTDLCVDLVGLYSRVAFNNGTLGQDPDTHKFTFNLRAYVDKKVEFLNFTLTALDQIIEQMEDEALSTGGYALFLKYKTEQHDLLLVALLKIKANAGIDPKTLKLTKNLNLDLNSLHEAARVNISRWNEGVQPYLTFVKGKAKSDQHDVSKYFRDALACTNYTDAKRHTELIIAAAEKFIEQNDDILPENKLQARTQVRTKLYECFIDVKDEIPLATVAAVVNPLNPDAFTEYVRAHAEKDGYNLGDSFSPHKPTYYKLYRFKAKMGGVHLAFDVEDVINGRVQYSEEHNAILVKNPAKNLKEAIESNGNVPDPVGE